MNDLPSAIGEKKSGKDKANGWMETENVEDKKSKKPRELSTQERLEELNKRLMLSLSQANPEPTKSVKIMQEISELPITLEVIRHSQNIVQNLKKIRNYKGNEKVKIKAATLYSHLKSKFVLAGTSMTTQLLKPPTKPARGIEQDKSGITLVKREEVATKDNTIEEVKTSKDEVKLTEEVLDSSDTKAEVDGNISKTEVENGHISEPTKEELKVEKDKSEAEPMEVVGTEESKTMDNAPREEEKTLEPTSPEDKTLDCVDMDIDDDDAPATNAQETNALETNVQDINAQEANLQDTNTESATAQDADKNNASCGGESVEKGLVVDQTVNDTSVKTDVKTSQINCTPESTVVNT